MSFSRWMLNILIAFDQLVNAIFLGDPDETISSRLGKKLRAGSKSRLVLYICGELDKAEKDHCKKSIEDDEGKYNLWK